MFWLKGLDFTLYVPSEKIYPVNSFKFYKIFNLKLIFQFYPPLVIILYMRKSVKYDYEFKFHAIHAIIKYSNYSTWLMFWSKEVNSFQFNKIFILKLISQFYLLFFVILYMEKSLKYNFKFHAIHAIIRYSNYSTWF